MRDVYKIFTINKVLAAIIKHVIHHSSYLVSSQWFHKARESPSYFGTSNELISHYGRPVDHHRLRREAEEIWVRRRTRSASTGGSSPSPTAQPR